MGGKTRERKKIDRSTMSEIIAGLSRKKRCIAAFDGEIGGPFSSSNGCCGPDKTASALRSGSSKMEGAFSAGGRCSGSSKREGGLAEGLKRPALSASEDVFSSGLKRSGSSKSERGRSPGVIGIFLLGALASELRKGKKRAYLVIYTPTELGVSHLIYLSNRGQKSGNASTAVQRRCPVVA